MRSATLLGDANDRLAGGRATPVVRLPAGHTVVAVAAADELALVVASEAMMWPAV